MALGIRAARVDDREKSHRDREGRDAADVRSE